MFIFILMPVVFTQINRYKIQIEDVYQEPCLLYCLSINDSTRILPDSFGDNSVYYVSMPEGSYRIKGIISVSDVVLDTIISFGKDSIITLYTNNSKSFWLKEFQSGFDNIYSNNRQVPAIGLKNDSTFLFKRFIHKSYEAYFLLEKGRYSMRNDTVSLSVYGNYTSSTQKLNRASGQYFFILKNDTLIDINNEGDRINLYSFK